MKKNKFTFLVVTSFLAVSALVGCNKSEEPSGDSTPISSEAPVNSDVINSSINNPDSSQVSGGSSAIGGSSINNSSSSQSGGSQEIKTDWTQDEKAAMSNYLHGLVLPFVAMDVTMSWNVQSGSLSMMSTDNMTADFLASYAAKYTTADGWEGGDVSEEYGFYPNSGLVYGFIKKVTQNNANYYISVAFAGFDNNAQGTAAYSKTGKFVLQTGEPYETSYPVETIRQWLDAYYGSNIVPPSFVADYYSLSKGAVYGYSENNNEADYKAQLEADEHFTVETNKNEDGYYVAHPSDGSYVLLFKYDENTKMMELKVSEAKGWNADVINAFLNKYNSGLVIPAIDNPNIGFRFTAVEETAGQEGGVITINNVNKDMVQSYVNSMKTAGYAFDNDVVNGESQWSSYAIFVTDAGTYTVALLYYPNENPQQLMVVFTVALDTTRVKQWPAVQVAAAVEASQDSVPAFMGTNYGFTFGTDSSYNYVIVYLASGTEGNAKTAYIQALLDNHYVDNGLRYGDSSYRSEHNEIVVTIHSTTSDNQSYLTILVEKFERTNWPANDIASAIVACLYEGSSITDTVPALDVDVAKSCYVNANSSDEFEIVIEGLAAFKDSFIKTLENQGWKEDAYYAFSPTGDPTTSLVGALVSPQRQLAIHFVEVENDLTIIVKKYIPDSLKVVGLNNDWDHNNSLITFEDATNPAQVAEHWYKTQSLATFAVRAGDKFKVTNGLDWYGYGDIQENALPSDTDFVMDNEKDQNIVAVKDGTVNLYLKEFDDGSRKLYVAYATPEPNPDLWPDQDVADILEDWGVTDEIPEIQDAVITDITVVPDGESNFVITLVDGAALLDDYETLLDVDFDFDLGEQLWLPASRKIAIHVYVDGENLVIDVGKFDDPAPATVYKVVGQFNDWKYEDGEELKPILEPDAGYLAQYIVTFNVEVGDAFKVADGSSWFGYDELLVPNDSFGSDGVGNFVAKYRGAVELKFGINTDGENKISIEFSKDENQPTELSYKLICEDNWDSLMADDAVFYAWVWGGVYSEGEKTGEWIQLRVDKDNHCFYLDDVSVSAEHLIIVRMNPNPDGEIEVPSWEAKWNQTGDIDFPEVGLTISFSIL